VGGTIGAGILRTPGLVAAQLGDPWLIWTAWIVGGLYALLGAVAGAELAALTYKPCGKEKPMMANANRPAMPSSSTALLQAAASNSITKSITTTTTNTTNPSSNNNNINNTNTNMSRDNSKRSSGGCSDNNKSRSNRKQSYEKLRKQ
jgi:hypothetical protein